jgi:4-amino-4-deoxy-L-arabinose transferase-like glycosyltransferase
MIDLKSCIRQREPDMLRDLLILAALFSIPFFYYLGQLPLIDPDEGRYAEIPREMLERGDLITPTLNYVLYFEKPPLLYWVNSASIKMFGLNEFAARLPSALSGLLTLLVTYAAARSLYGRSTALLSAIILGTSAGFVLQSRIILTDMLLTFCLTSALFAFIVAVEKYKERNRTLIFYLFYIFCALALLTKGLIGIVFPVGIIFFYLLLSGQWRVLKDMRLPSGLLIFSVIAVPWFVAVSMKNPEFARFFFIHEHFERFTSTVHGRYQPFWFFVPVLAATMLPWSFCIPGATVQAWRSRNNSEGRLGIYLLIWAGLIFLFYSISSSKLIPYILPVFPPLAILVAHRIETVLASHEPIPRLAAVLGTVLTILGVASMFYQYIPATAVLLADAVPDMAKPLRQFASNAPQISLTGTIVIGSIFMVQGLACLATAGRNPRQLFIIICFASFLLEILLPRVIMAPIAQVESPRFLALKARSLAGPESKIATFGPMQAVSWYTGRRVIVTGKPDELAFGSRQGDQSDWFPDQQALLKIWSSKDHLLIVLKKSELDRILPLLFPFPRIHGESGRIVLIGNR